MLFHVGYFEALPKVLGNSALQKSYPLSLFVLGPSAITDSSELRRGRKADLEAKADQVFLRLDRLGQIQPGARMRMGLNMTDRNLDYIALTLTITLPGQSSCA